MKLNDKVYDILKWITILCLPALAVLWSTLAGVWNLPLREEVTSTINAVAVFLGALLGVSSVTYGKETASSTIAVTTTDTTVSAGAIITSSSSANVASTTESAAETQNDNTATSGAESSETTTDTGAD